MPDETKTVEDEVSDVSAEMREGYEAAVDADEAKTDAGDDTALAAEATDGAGKGGDAGDGVDGDATNKAGKPAAAAKADEATPESLEERVKALEQEETGPDDGWWNEVLSAHPNAERVLQSEALAKWVQEQPAAVQARFKIGATPAETIRGLYQFNTAMESDAKKGEDAGEADKPKRTFAGDKYKGVKVVTPSGEIDLDTMAAHDDTGYGDVADMVDAMIEHRLAHVTQQIQQRNAALEAEVTNMRFQAAVRSKHPDADTVESSKEFQDWIGAKGKGYAKLYREGTVGDVVDVLAQYKREAVRGAAGKARDSQRERRDRNSAVSKSLLGASRRSAPGAGAEVPEDDLKAGFYEGIKAGANDR